MRLRRLGAAVAIVALTAMGVSCGDEDAPSGSPASSGEGSVAPSGSEAGSTSSPASSATSVAPGSSSESSAPAEEITKGGTITYISSVNVTSMDPVSFISPMSAGAHIYAVRAFPVYDALAWENWETGEVELRLAESIETTDGTTWTMKLRDGIRFSDGTPFDAEAVKFHFDRVADPANQSPLLGQAQQIASIEIVDPLTLQFTLKAADNSFDRLVANNFPFIPSPTAVQEKGADFANSPVGAGPFLIKDGWSATSDTMSFTVNPDYYGDPPNIDGITVNVVLDGEQAFNTVQTGGAQIMVSPDPTLALRAEDAGLVGSHEGITSGGREIMFNTSVPPFDDVRARQAIAYALDMDAMVETLYAGAKEAAHGLFGSTSPFYVESATQLEADPAKAQALLDELAADGKPLSFTLSLSDTLQSYGEVVQAQLSAFDNLEVTLNIGVSLPLAQSVNQGNYQAAVWGHTWIDPNPIMDALFKTGETTNLMRYSNPEMDAALADGHTALTEADRVAAYEKVQEIWVEDVPTLYIDRAFVSYVTSPKVKGLATYGTGAPRWDLIWLEA